jgi:hypothetical protein
MAEYLESGKSNGGATDWFWEYHLRNNSASGPVQGPLGSPWKDSRPELLANVIIYISFNPLEGFLASF